MSACSLACVEFPPHRTTESRTTIKGSRDGCQKRIACRRAGSGKRPDLPVGRSWAIQSTACAHALLIHKSSISVVRRTRAAAKATAAPNPNTSTRRLSVPIVGPPDPPLAVKTRADAKKSRRCGKRAHGFHWDAAAPKSSACNRAALPADQAGSKGSCILISGKSPIGPHPPAGHARIVLSVIGARFTRALSFANRCQADDPRGGAVAVAGRSQ